MNAFWIRHQTKPYILGNTTYLEMTSFFTFLLFLYYYIQRCIQCMEDLKGCPLNAMTCLMTSRPLNIRLTCPQQRLASYLIFTPKIRPLIGFKFYTDFC